MSYTLTGFGLDVPTSLGTKQFDVNAKMWCGSQAAIQQMLKDLGYYKDIIDGKITTNGPTYKAMVKFAQDVGVPVASRITPAFCQMLQDAWSAQMAPPKTDRPITRPDTSRKMSYGTLFAPRKDAAIKEEDKGGTAAATTSWWGGLSVGAKVGIVGAAAAVGIAAVYVAVK